ncbi:hypothetical protein KSP40_PGU015280 [Platanthera guangdongensis]|uniref:Pirin-like protein n=1 Tax=Platanthera guangdongensis TaxID=2320717 RepID=A0ABR2LU98_9ASPA
MSIIRKSFSISTFIYPHLFFPNLNLFFLTKQRNKSFSTIMATSSTNSVANRHEIPQILNPRTIVKKVSSKPQQEGVGVIVRRSIGTPELKNLDPFLMLDYATFSPPNGFPDHPHRGFETVTYVLEGALKHEDFAGHRGIIRAGDLQWMTAGKGILHSELPTGDIPNKGLQLWINLSSKDKMIEPNYQELQSKDINRAQKDGIDVRVIAGEAFGVRSPIYTRTPTMYLDFTMNPGAELQQLIPRGWNAFAYIVEGEGVFGEEGSSPSTAHNVLVLSNGDGVRAWNKSGGPLRFMLIAGQPLNEPVVQYGPFVMNTREEIQQTLEDYQLCKNGFEKAKHWKSRR